MLLPSLLVASLHIHRYSIGNRDRPGGAVTVLRSSVRAASCCCCLGWKRSAVCVVLWCLLWRVCLDSAPVGARIGPVGAPPCGGGILPASSERKRAAGLPGPATPSSVGPWTAHPSMNGNGVLMLAASRLAHARLPIARLPSESARWSSSPPPPRPRRHEPLARCVPRCHRGRTDSRSTAAAKSEHTQQTHGHARIGLPVGAREGTRAWLAGRSRAC